LKNLELTSDEQEFVDQQQLLVETRAPLMGRLMSEMKFKQTLTERLGVEKAFTACRQSLGVPQLDQLRKRRVLPVLQVAREQPEFTELWPGGEEFTHTPPTVVGRGDHETLRGISRSAFLSCLKDITVRGRSAVLLGEDWAAFDFEPHELAAFQDNPEFDPAVLKSDTAHFWTMEPANAPVLEEGFYLTGTYAHDFGHWIAELLPRLAAAKLAGLPSVPLLIDSRMPATHRQSLELFCPEHELIVLEHLSAVQVRRLWYSPNLAYRGFSPSNWSEAWESMLSCPAYFARAIRFLKSLAEEPLAPPTGKPRLFLARKPGQKKLLVNHRAIEQVAKEYDFEIVYPQDLTFLEQLRLVHHAKHIVAPDGSNGLLAYFAGRHTRVALLNHEHTRPLVALNGLFTELAGDLTLVTGPVDGPRQEEPFWNNYRIDEQGFKHFLRDWLKESRA